MEMGEYSDALMIWILGLHHCLAAPHGRVTPRPTTCFMLQIRKLVQQGVSLNVCSSQVLHVVIQL